MTKFNAFKMSVLASTLAMTACTDKSNFEFATQNRSSSEFTASLAKEYTALSQRESHKYNNTIEAQHFAIKSMRANEGEMVMPESLEEWDLHKSNLATLVDGRQRLLSALEKGGRYIEPTLAAQTQVSFDCMVAELEDRSDKNSPTCQKGFMQHLEKLESALLQNGNVLTVKFDSKGMTLNQEGQNTIKEIAERAKKFQNRQIMLVSHTDPLGKATKNLNLSHGRLMAVKDALIAHGLSNRNIKIVATRGQLRTVKKVIEPRHQEVDIYLY